MVAGALARLTCPLKPAADTDPPNHTEGRPRAAEVDADEADLRRIVDDRFVMNAADGSTPGKEELIRMVLGTTELHLRSPDGAEQTAAYRYTSVL